MPENKKIGTPNGTPIGGPNGVPHVFNKFTISTTRLSSHSSNTNDEENGRWGLYLYT